MNCLWLVVVALLCISCGVSAQYTKYVDTTIGTGGSGYGIGSVPVGAQRPFGAARLSPDTVAFDDIFLSFNHYGGYYYDDSHIRVFSHTHTVGAGVTDLGNIGVMPVSKTPSADMLKKYGFRSSFRHDTEITSPGYYSVLLEDPKVKAELTATMHVGVHKYTWQSSGSSMYMLIYVSHALTPGACTSAWVDIDPKSRLVTGWMVNAGSLSRRFGGVKTYFVAQFDQSFTDYGVWSSDKVYDTITQANGTDIGAYIGFGSATSSNNVVTFRVAISFISVAQAFANLAAEVQTGASFDDVMKESVQVWEEALRMVEVHDDVTSDNQDNFVKFYTALYHALLAPTIFSESGGVYLGFDNSVHKLDAAHSNYYTDMSIWDVHRTQFPLLALLAPTRMADIVNSLVLMYQQGGFIPRWPLANGYTDCMIGTHADIVIADAYFKGIRNFDVKTAYQGLRQAATTPQTHAGRTDIPDWVTIGFIPYEQDSHAVCDSMSYAFDDWAVGNLAGALGLAQDEALFLNRSTNYKNVWDPETQFFCPKTKAGEWKCPDILIDVFDVRYVEGDAWQWRWFVPHDPEGLISLFQSEEYFISELDEFFSRSAWDSSNFMPNPYYWAGNEPDIFAAFLFAFAGRPDLTQKYVRWVMDNKYPAQPDGLPGNDDYGTMSAWLVFGVLGFYPQAGSPEGRYILGSPLFNNITVHLPNNDLQIIAYNNSPKNVYATKIALNQQLLGTPFIYHNNITSGNGTSSNTSSNNSNNTNSVLLEFWMSDAS